jgi:hypothetical protein
MKLFMMPQTVPNSPTKGAVARCDPLLDAVPLHRAGGQLQLGHRRVEELADLALGIGESLQSLCR